MGKTGVLFATLFGASLIPSTAVGQGDDFIYLDCDLTSEIFLDEQEEVVRFKEYYRFSESQNEIGIYRLESNLYESQCDIYQCEVSNSNIKTEKFIDEDTHWETTINRMTGVFRAINSVDASFAVLISGSCSRGQSQVVGTKRF